MLSQITFLILLCKHVNVLIVLRTNGHHKFSTNFKLFNQSVWNIVLGTSSHMYCIILRFLWIPHSPITNYYFDFLTLKCTLIWFAKVLNRKICQLLDVFYSNYACLLMLRIFYHFIKCSTKNSSSWSNIQHFCTW